MIHPFPGPEQVARSEIEAALREWGEKSGQDIFQPGRSKVPFVIKIDERARRAKFNLPGDGGPLAGFSSPEEEKLFPWKFQQVLWFDKQNDSIVAVCYVEDHFHPLLCHSLRLAQEEEHILSRVKREESPMAMQNKQLVEFIVTWCHEQGFDPFDDELPTCYYVQFWRSEGAAKSEFSKLRHLLGALCRLVEGIEDEDTEALEKQLELKVQGQERIRELARRAFEVKQELRRVTLLQGFDSLLYFPSLENYIPFKIAVLEKFPDIEDSSGTLILQ